MANDIGNITASLKLESAAFIRELTKASQATQRNTAAMQKSMASLQSGFAAAGATFKGVVAGFVSIAALRGLQRLGAAAIETADSIGAAASKMGIAVDELQRLQHAAAQVDVEAGALDAAFRKFQATLATGKIKQEGKTIGEAFRAAIEQIAQAPTLLEKTRLAQEAFGNRGFQVGLQLAAQWQTFNQELERTFTISREAVDIASRLDNEYRSFSNAVAAGFQTGFLEAFAGQAALTEGQLREINEVAQTTGMVIANAFRLGTAMVRVLYSALQEVGNFDWDGLAAKIRSALPQPGEGSRLPGDNGDTSLFGVQASASASGIEAGAGIKAAAEALAVFNPLLGEGVNKTKEFAEATRALRQAESEREQLIAATRTPYEEYIDQMQRMSDLSKQVAIDAETMGRAQMMAAAMVVQPWLQVADVAGQALGTLFEDNKMVAIAQAIVNTAQGVTAALAQYPPPLSFAMAAAQAALGAAQIATIKSTRPGGGGSAKRPSAGGGRGAAVSGGGGGPALPDRAIFIDVRGEGLLSTEQVRGLIGQLIDAQKDGAKLVLSQK